MYDVYTTARLLMAVKGLDPATSFLRDRYFPTHGEVDIFHHKKVLVEYRDGDRRLGPVVVPRKNGVPVSREGQVMYEMEPAKVAPNRPLTIDDLTERGFGEALYGDKTPQQREQIIVTQDLQELDNLVTRREEYMAAQTMLNNGFVMEQIGDDTEKPLPLEIRYYEEKKNPATYTPTKKWDSADATILADFDAMATFLTQRGLAASDFVCAPDVADAILMNETIQRLLDNRRYDLGQVAPTLEAPGASIVAVLNVKGRQINVISYDEVYTDDDGKTQPYIPSGCGIMTAPDAGRTVYGAVTQLEQDGRFHTYSEPRVPLYDASVSGQVRTITLTSRPLTIPNNRNPWMAASQLLTAD